MNTECLAGLLLGLVLLGCSHSEDEPTPEPVDEGVATSYTLLLTQGGDLSSTTFNANALAIVNEEGIKPILGPEESQRFSYRDQNSISFLDIMEDCTVNLNVWDTGSLRASLTGILGGSPTCDKTILSAAHCAQSGYIGYSMPGSGMKEELYFLRALKLDDASEVFADISLEKAPIQLVWSSGRIFVLNYDSATGKNSLLVIDDTSGTVETELDLGFEVLKILKNRSGQLVIGYQGRHLAMDPGNLEVVSRVQYAIGKEPNFANSVSHYFDPAGILYYNMPANPENTPFENIAAVYDFSKYTAYLYFYENFLSSERIAQYSIGNTSCVAFDHHNGLLLIGYAKVGTSGKGGLLRIKPVPEPSFIDQADLDGVPVYLFVE